MQNELGHLQVLDMWENHPGVVSPVAPPCGQEDAALGGRSTSLPIAHGQ